MSAANTQRRIRLIIADDHEVFRDGLRTLLDKTKGIEVVGEAGNGGELVSLCERFRPDIVLTDILMPGMDGIEASNIITNNFPGIRVIALSMFNHEDLVIDMLNAGAVGFLVKNAHKSEIIQAVFTVYRNKPYYCKLTSARMPRVLARIQSGSELRQKVYFSPREKEIIRLVCEEKTSREIAALLHMSVRTVEEYRVRIKEKMDVKSTTGLVIYAIQHQLYKMPARS